jgi:hypothetical protein
VRFPAKSLRPVAFSLRGQVSRYVPMIVAGLVIPSVAISAENQPVDFSRDIRPILSRNCFACHGPDEHDRQAGLRLDDRDAAVAELDSGLRAIAPGDPAASELVARIRESDPDLLMPPPESHHLLTEQEKQLLERWIADGAAYAPHWAYVPPQAWPTPEPADSDWPQSWIDAFVLMRLEQEGLSPSVDADPVTLIRRLHLDLTGLPPTPAAVDAFLADASPAAFDDAVDELLASPRHAERLASWWLDLVRYADTVGYHGDQTHNASPYRDWVIHAFLENLPFDRFTLLQLAGDLVEPAVGEHPDDRGLAAAYHRLLQTSHEGGIQVNEYRAIYQADRVRNLSEVWLGGTLGCSQCHDHKYDPFTARDFYAMGAFFADIDDERHMGNAGFGGGTNTLPTTRFPERQVVGPFERAEAERLDAEISQLTRQLPAPPTTQLVKEATGAAEPAAKEPDEHAALRARLAVLEQQRASLARTVMVTESLKTPREVRVLPRGNWMDETGEVVEPAVPAFLGRLTTDGRPGRDDLARWLVTPTAEGGIGELTARVLVNRLWALFFGEGLCRSTDDFGGQGEPPDHPQLLDRLAVELVASGWDLRSLIRQIVTSRSYRQSSEASAELLARDPGNRLLARQGRWRLPAEHVRDAALFSGGLLAEQLGGPSVRPYQPAGYYQHLNFPKRTYQADTGSQQWRRGLYVHWQRMFLHPQMAAFDAPTREECTARRLPSNTPTQALVLLNDPTFVEAARGLAERALRAASDDRERIVFLWRQAVSRSPDAAEQNLLQQLLARRRNEYAAQPEAAEALLGVGIAAVETDILGVELAAWTAVARGVLNLHEAIARY